ncbi:MAG: GH25 family lysozyme [Anaerolineaceae bacterium]
MNTELLDTAKRFMATQFPVWGGDGSQHMDRKETAKFPDLAIIPDIGGSFISWKATQGAGDYGFVDRTFLTAWQKMREYNAQPDKFVARFPFHFWDYRNYVGSAELFGSAQARFFWKTIKADPGEIKGYLDAESFSAWGYINAFNNSKPMQIARGFVKEFGNLAGYQPGLYTNLGMLPFFGDFFRGLDLWLAWYNKAQDLAAINKYLKKYEWRGRLCFWQYASDGDLDQDGVGDGLRLGMEEKNFDLDIWMRSMGDFSVYCGKTSIPVIIPSTEDAVEQNNLAEVKTMTIKNPTGLNVRAKPAAGDTQILTWFPNGAKVNTVEKLTIGADIWRKRREGGYCAEVFNGFRYLV